MIGVNRHQNEGFLSQAGDTRSFSLSSNKQRGNKTEGYTLRTHVVQTVKTIVIIVSCLLG